MLQRLDITTLSAPGASSGDQVKVENQRLTTGKNAGQEAVSYFKSGSFDIVSGVLTLTHYNGTAIKVTGFPSLTSLPRGPDGDPGPRGRDGKDGADGRDGEDGAQGCTGPDGSTGATGNPGREGRPGLPGPAGLPGVRGNRGPRGRPGPDGPTGKVGPTGPTGNTGPTGPDGQPGPPGAVNIIVSSVDPGNVAPGTLWVNPNVDQPPIWI